MPIQNVWRDNGSAEALFRNFFQDKPIDPWLYDTCYYLEINQATQLEKIEETVELKRIIGVTHGGYGPDAHSKHWSVNWLGWFYRLALGKSASHRQDPFGQLDEALAEGNNSEWGFNLYLYKLLIANQPFYFIGEGHHRITFLKIRGDLQYHFKHVVPLISYSETAIHF